MKTEPMERRKRYTPEFNAQVLELYATGKPISEVAEDFCVSKDLIYAWKHKADASDQLRSKGQDAVGGEDVAKELIRGICREVAELPIDNDILKKAALLLGTKNQKKPAK